MLASIVACVFTSACLGPPRGDCWPECAQYAPPPPAQYDLILTEADSGGVGVSTGTGVAFLLDNRRDSLITSPALDVRPVSDLSTRHLSQRVFAIPPFQYGVFDVTASGVGMAPFTFHLTIGRLLPFPHRATVLHRGDLVVQEGGVSLGPNYQSTALAGPTFQLAQDVVAVGAAGELLKNKPAPARRAYRANQLGAQVVSSTAFTSYRIVVADTPPAFEVFLDGEVQMDVTFPIAAAGDVLAAVFTGDRRQVTWSAQPADAFVRLPAAELGPQPRGATLVPFRVMVEGNVTLEVHAVRPASPGVTFSIQSGQATCLPDDFPRYSLAHMTSFGGQLCVVYMSSADSTARVLAFYRSALNEGDWRVGAAAGSPILFFRRSNPSFGGTVDVAGGVITIRMNF